MFLKKYISFLFIFCFSLYANADDYQWSGFGAPLYPSLPAACDSIVASINTPDSTQIATSTGFRFPVPSRYDIADCIMSTVNKGDVDQVTKRDVYTRVGRIGGGCTAPNVYNAASASCTPPPEDPCKNKTDFINHEHQVGNLGGTAPRAEPPISICENSCQYSFTVEAPSACYRFAGGVDKNPDGAFCKYKYKGNGISCTNGPTTPPGSVFDQPPTTPPIALDPTLTKDSQCSDWSTTAEGAGTRTCTSVAEYKDPGKINCDGSSPTVACFPSIPSPAYTKTETSETVTSKTNSDGSKDNTTTKTTDKTSCYGVKTCTSTSATEVKTDGTKADGTANDNVKGSTCTGNGCKDVDKDTSKDDPSKDPEKDDEDKEPRVATGGGSCDAPPSCSGDAIDCAVLAEQNKARCNAEEAGDFPKHKSEIEGLLSGDKFTASPDENITVESFVNSGARFLPATCPVDSTFNLSFAGGHSFALSYAPFCFFAESLAPLIVIAASVFAALYVGRAFGGE